MSTTPPKLYGQKQSTPHAMHPTTYSFKSSLARHLMSCSMGRSRTSPLECLVANATSTRSDNTQRSFKDDVQVIDRPSSSNVPQDDDKDGRVENKDIHVSHDQMMAQAQDIDAPQPPPQVVDRRNSSILQAHPHDLIIGSPSKGVMTRSQKLALFIEHHSFVSCIEPKNVEEALQDLDWINAMYEELNNFT